MKNPVKIWLIVFCLSLVTACNKYDQLNEDLKSDIKNAQVFVVSPNGTDDTQNIIVAFENAKAAGEGSTVELTAGTFKIGMIEIHEFDGYFKGDGKENTIITNLCCLPCQEALAINVSPSLLKFIGGDINISDMTFHLTDTQLCADITDDLMCLLTLADYSTVFVPTKRHIKATVKNVDFIAGLNADDYWQTPGNVFYAIWGGSDWGYVADNLLLSSGEYNITNCSFKDNVGGITITSLDDHSKVLVENNTIENSWTNIYFGISAGADFTIKGNTFSGPSAFWDTDGMDILIDGNDYGWFAPEQLTNKINTYSITDNEFNTPGDMNSILIMDNVRAMPPGSVTPSQIDVKGNKFITDGSIAIMSLVTKDAKFLNNEFSGTGPFGILVDGDEPSGTYAEKNHLINNDFSGSDYSDASIFLGPYSMECLVVGVPYENVIDLGVNNIVTGSAVLKSGTSTGKANPYMVKPLRGKFQVQKGK